MKIIGILVSLNGRLVLHSKAFTFQSRGYSFIKIQFLDSLGTIIVRTYNYYC